MSIDYVDLIVLYVQMLDYALPIAFFIGVSNIIINMFTSAAFSGRLQIGGKK